MRIQEMIDRLRSENHNDLAKSNELLAQMRAWHAEERNTAEGGPLSFGQADVDSTRTLRESLTDRIELRNARIAELLREQRLDEVAHGLQSESWPTGVRRGGSADEHRGPGFVYSGDNTRAALRRGESFNAHPVVVRSLDSAREQAVVGQHGSLGQMVRALSTGGASAVIPTIWAGSIVDRARNYAAVLQAGASVVPMAAKTVQIGRLTGDPTAAFRTEGSTITASDPTFDNVTLDAKTMSCLTVASLEWLQDASPDGDNLIEDAIAKSMALALDLAALYGGVTTGSGSINLPTPPSPRGVLAALLAVAPSSVLGDAANGTTQTAASYWNEVIDTIGTVKDNNEMPSAAIWNSKLERQYAKAYDTQGQPLMVPEAVAALPRLVSNQVPSYTRGTMVNRATDLFVGDWSQLLIGQRMDFTIQVLTERYAENGQVGIVAHWRGDVQPARPRSFAVYRALQGA
ncbi:MAG: phage major capsid protein [Sporichthyaceae bacterium]